MSGYLLDTNVVSEFTRVRPEPKVISWFQATSEELLYLSVLTIGEIRKGIDTLPRSNKRALLESWLANDLVLRFAGRILEVNLDIAERWGLISAQAKIAGTPLAVIDGLMAATALHHNLTLVTRNTRDVRMAGINTLNPWEL
ncbi:MAG TPA: type II toxin-antitoxin system VapC family toxin [Candidatus Angelobacter sp.]|nr:type II toxin-antitoxin system VapC family toxin [Candidatus Angelobacter sp.]